MERKSRRKIAIVGAEGFDSLFDETQVISLPWSKLTPSYNFRDFDELILNFHSAPPPADRAWDVFDKIMTFEIAMSILIPGGAIYVLGDSRGASWTHSSPTLASVKAAHLQWTGCTFHWDARSGDSLKYSSDAGPRKLKSFLPLIKQWDYSCSDTVSHHKLTHRGVWGDIYPLEPNLVAHCRTRYDTVVAMDLFYRYWTSEKGPNSPQVSGHITFLPRTTLSVDETILRVLRDLCKVSVVVEPPKWSQGVAMPGQEFIDKAISERSAELFDLTEKLADLREKRGEMRSPIGILYERGLSLERAVRAMLGELGAKVLDPVEDNQEDGWISVETAEGPAEGVLEIKSTSNDSFGEEGRRQLFDWIERGEKDKEKTFKGIFIGSNMIDTAPWLRQDGFSASWRKAAARQQIVALKVEDLLMIYVLWKLKKVELANVWSDIFGTNGVFDPSSYREQMPEQYLKGLLELR